MLRFTDDMTPFDMTEKPSKQYFFLMPLIWIAAYLDTRKFGLKTDHSGMKGVKPPYLVFNKPNDTGKPKTVFSFCLYRMDRD